MSQRKRNAVHVPPPAHDDFQLISGIGPVVAGRLHDAGISRYQDLAALSPERIAAMLANVAGISAERIANQDWPTQARELAASASEASADAPVVADVEGQQHYAAFHVELLLGPDDAIRRTQVRHYHSDNAESWPGWEPDELVAWLFKKASPARPAAVELPASPIRVESLAPSKAGNRSNFMAPDDVVSVRFAVTVNSDDAVDRDNVDLGVTVEARVVGGSARHPIGSTQANAAVGEPLWIELTGTALPPGWYVLEADAAAYVGDHGPEDKPLLRHRAVGELVHVSEVATAAPQRSGVSEMSRA